MSVVVTGVAGFIGFHVAKRLLSEGYQVIGIDNFSQYYDVKLKRRRVEKLRESVISPRDLIMYEIDISDANKVEEVFVREKPQYVFNFAAQAGVRYSITNPGEYIQTNLVGFSNILESSKSIGVEHLVYASSSSVYGGNKKLPFSEEDSVDHPLSLYAATKRSNELLAHAYSNIHGLKTTGLRFFTVYGPWGRPDMALFLFAKAILEKKPVELFNKGNMVRDFTYIDDLVEAIFRIVLKPPISDSLNQALRYWPNESWCSFRILNIGSAREVPLLEYLETLETCLGAKAEKVFLPMQDGDVEKTKADLTSLDELIEYKPNTSIADGVSRFVSWYKEYYNVL